jgi:hypothetical protein
MPQRWLNLSAATIGASALPRSVETEGTLSRVIGDLLFQSHAHYLNIYLFQMLPGIHYSSSRSLSHHDSSLMTMLILTAASLPLIIMDFIGYAVFIAIHRPLLWFTLPSTTFRDYDTWRFFKYVKVCWSVVKMLGSVLVLFYAHYQLIIITLGNISGLIGQLIQHLFWAASIFIVANERTLTYISQSLLSRFHSNKNDTSMMVNMCTFHLIWAIVSVENWLVGLSRAFLSTVISLTLLCCTMLSIWPVY